MLCAKSLQSCSTLCDPVTVARQAPLSMRFCWQKHWSGLPFPAPGDLPDPGIKPLYLTSPALAGGFFTTIALWDQTNELVFKVKTSITYFHILYR